jgi:hypothetical protein
MRRARLMLLAIVVIVALALLAVPLAAEAQPTGRRVPRIGYLDGASLSANSVRIDALRQGLRELGYVEGQDIAFEWRSAEGQVDRLPGLAAELVRLGSVARRPSAPSDPPPDPTAPRARAPDGDRPFGSSHRRGDPLPQCPPRSDQVRWVGSTLGVDGCAVRRARRISVRWTSVH